MLISININFSLINSFMHIVIRTIPYSTVYTFFQLNWRRINFFSFIVLHFHFRHRYMIEWRLTLILISDCVFIFILYYYLTIIFVLFVYLLRSVANCLSEIDHQIETVGVELADDIEMASIAEEEDLDEKFSHQGTSTGKHSGKKKVVKLFYLFSLPNLSRSSLNNLNSFSFFFISSYYYSFFFRLDSREF